MAQALTPDSQNIFYNLLALKQEYKEKKALLKSDPATHADFLTKVRNCQFQFEQIQNSMVGPEKEKVSQVVQKQLNPLFQKVRSLAPVQQRIPAHLFRTHRTQEALAAFKEMETEFPWVVEKIYENLWQLKGYPQKISSKKELFFSALDTERAEAILLNASTPQMRLLEIAQLFAIGDNVTAFERFLLFAIVYPKIADCIYGKVWEAYGRPTKENHLAHIADDNFGYVAFHNVHPNGAFEFNSQHNGKAIQWIMQDLPRYLTDQKFLSEQNVLRLDRRCVEVASETVDLFKDGKYTSRDGKTHNLKEHLKISTEQTRVYRDAGSHEPRKPRFEKTIFEVRSQNCVEMAYDLSFHGGNVLVLNLANSYKFGGAYKSHRGTQEEELCRCTGLAPAVNKEHGVQQREFYPLHKQENAGRAGGLYTPQVLIIRMGMQNDYQFYDVPMPMAVASFAAYEKPNLDYSNPSGPRLQGEELHWTREKVRTIYQAAYDNGHDTLILGALGCGAFANPPKHIAELFRDVGELEFKGCFKYVGFAVLEDMNDGKAHNPEGNFKPFAQMVQQQGGQAYTARGEKTNL